MLLRSRENSSVASLEYFCSQYELYWLQATKGSAARAIPGMGSFSTSTFRAASVGSPIRSYFPSW